MHLNVIDVFRTSLFWAPFSAWLIAQMTKMLCGFTRTRRLDFRYLVSTGGMPSAHSAMASALATVMGLSEGFRSAPFIMALAFAIVVMFDAATVRRAAGQQSRLLNEMLDELFKTHRFSEQKLVELLGHTRLEVFLGLVMGVLTAIAVFALDYIGFWR